MTARVSSKSPAACAVTTIVALVVLATARPDARSQRRPDTSARAVVSALAGYVADYQRQFAAIVADEDYVQELRTSEGPATRRLTGELFLTYLVPEGTWMAVHDVSEVDGVPVADREDLRALLRTTSIQSIARRLVDRNARFNLGTITRNFNEPTIALQIASASRIRSVRFEVTDVDRQNPEAPLVTLEFREREPPTLVHGIDGRPVYARGSFVVEAAAGRVQQSVITFDNGTVRAELETQYGPNDAMGLWVPQEWRERYEANDRRRREVVLGRARYSNYRRFEAVGRIK